MQPSAAFTPDGSPVEAPGDAGMKLWDAADKMRELPGGLHCAGQGAAGCDVNWLGVAISPDRKMVAGPGKSGTIVVWDLGDGQRMMDILCRTLDTQGACIFPQRQEFIHAGG